MATSKYELHAFAKGADGSVRPFHLDISEAWRHPEFGWECRVVCEALRKKPMKMFGEDPDDAMAMALALIKRLLEYAEWTLVDDRGKPVVLPQIPMQA